MKTVKQVTKLLVAAALLAGLSYGLAQGTGPALAPASVTPQPAAPTTTVPRALNGGERRALRLPGFGWVAYYSDPRGTGRPLVLTHSVNAAASAYEMKPLWDAYAGTRPVYALEWPGFGSSDRPDVRYTPELMAEALRALVGVIGSDVDVVGLSLGSEFAARAALSEPRIRSLALISPSGLGQPRGNSQEAEDAGRSQQLYDRLNRIGDPLYGVIRSRLSIQYFLSRSFRGPVPENLVDYSYVTSRQPGAKYAPLYFLSGQLFTSDAYRDLYAKLSVPALVLYDQDAFVSFDRLPLFAQQPGAQVVRIPETDGLPQWEKLAETKAALDAFWTR